MSFVFVEVDRSANRQQMQIGIRLGQPRLETDRIRRRDHRRVILQATQFDFAADTRRQLLLERTPVEQATGSINAEPSQRPLDRIAEDCQPC